MFTALFPIGRELTSRSLHFAPDELTHATGESKLPSLAKEGWSRHQENGPDPLKGAAGLVGSTTDEFSGGLNEPPRPLPSKVASHYFILWSRPPLLCQALPRRGVRLIR